MEHKYAKTCHADHFTHVADCQCGICDGALAYCINCHCAEGSLPTECPGSLVTDARQDRIYKGEIDYSCNHWFEKEKA